MKRILTVLFALVLAVSVGASAPIFGGFRVASAATGGPDAYGYYFTDSGEPGGPAYDWTEISGSGTWLEDLSDGDDESENVPIGFNFSFYGNFHASVYVSSNGFLTFHESGSDSCDNDPIPYTDTDDPNDLIAPFWDDLNPGSGGDIYYETRGTAPNRQFIVQWDDVQHYDSDSSGVNFEAILYEGSGDILFQYEDVNFGDEDYDSGADATVGIEDSAGTVGLQYSCDTASLSDSLAILFYLLNPPTPPTLGDDWDEGDDYKMHWPQLPDLENGQVFESSINDEGTAEMADDFLCTESGYITDIHVWGGWYQDSFPDDASFWIGIYSDIPADAPGNPEGYSMPGELLWERHFGLGNYTWRYWEFSETIDYYYPGESYWTREDCSDVYQYNFWIDAEDAFYQEQDEIYWLSVVVTYADDGGDDTKWWGWISCLPEDKWNDDGAWYPIEEPGAWQELFYLVQQVQWYPSEDSADLAFVITTTTPTPPPPPVGGELYPVNKLGILTPWLVLALVLVMGGGILVLKRRQAH